MSVTSTTTESDKSSNIAWKTIMAFAVQKWLSDIDVYKLLVSKGFKIMQDLDRYERQSLLYSAFEKKDTELTQEFINNGLELTYPSIEND